MDTKAILQNSNEKRWLVVFAWLAMLCVSDLADIVAKAIFGQVPQGLFLYKIAVLVLFLGLSSLWGKLRPLRPYVFVMLILFMALTASEWIRTSSWWKALTGGMQSSFLLGYLSIFARDTGVALIVILALWIVKRRRRDFFLVRGQLDAPIEPVRWLGIGQGESWRTFGWIFALAATLAVAVPTLLGIPLSSDVLRKAIPLLPAAVLFAAINAFNEEIYYRATLLSTLSPVIGKNHALLINCAFFGLAHYLYGSPPGIVGFMMTGFLAWLLGKSMLETKGFFWPWFIHFLPDVAVFASYALLWVQ